MASESAQATLACHSHVVPAAAAVVLSLHLPVAAAVAVVRLPPQQGMVSRAVSGPLHAGFAAPRRCSACAGDRPLLVAPRDAHSRSQAAISSSSERLCGLRLGALCLACADGHTCGSGTAFRKRAGSCKVAVCAVAAGRNGCRGVADGRRSACQVV